eukprot:4661200-Pleurochrysis_carterae.AAC.1
MMQQQYRLKLLRHEGRDKAVRVKPMGLKVDGPTTSPCGGACARLRWCALRSWPEKAVRHH